MHVCEATFTSEEVKQFLVDDGLSPGTPQFLAELRRRYVPGCDGQIGFEDQCSYYENPLWDGERSSL